jgi:hypothetical protein
MLREGARPEVVRDILGHANTDVTQNVYGRAPTPPHKPSERLVFAGAAYLRFLKGASLGAALPRPCNGTATEVRDPAYTRSSPHVDRTGSWAARRRARASARGILDAVIWVSAKAVPLDRDEQLDYGSGVSAPVAGSMRK